MVGACVLALFVANTINIGADLSGMADAMSLLTHVSSHVWVVVAGVAIGWATVRLRYVLFAKILRWLALVLLVYVVTAFYLHPDWKSVGKAKFIPSLPHGRAAWATLVAILGTTISPYLFFWQASEEVEEEKSRGRATVEQRRGASKDEIFDRKIDVAAGTFFSNAVMFFIILTTALTLHPHGITSPRTCKVSASAERLGPASSVERSSTATRVTLSSVTGFPASTRMVQEPSSSRITPCNRRTLSKPWNVNPGLP